MFKKYGEITDEAEDEYMEIMRSYLVTKLGEKDLTVGDIENKVRGNLNDWRYISSQIDKGVNLYLDKT